MKKLLCFLLVVLGCSAADGEDVGSLSQELNTCLLTVTNPVRSGNTYTWSVKNIGPGCPAGYAARTELYKFCASCSVKKQLLFAQQPLILGPNETRGFSAAAPASCWRNMEHIVADASWVPSGSATRKHASPSGYAACP